MYEKHRIMAINFSVNNSAIFEKSGATDSKTLGLLVQREGVCHSSIVQLTII